MGIVIKSIETEEEIRGKAYVHWKSWQESYVGIVDAGYLARLTLEKCDRTISLPMKGRIESLNASVAAGILMYEIVRARAR